jgi:hypothetical protein
VRDARPWQESKVNIWIARVPGVAATMIKLAENVGSGRHEVRRTPA